MGEGCVRGAQPIEIYKSNMLTRIRTVNRVAFVHVRMCVCVLCTVFVCVGADIYMCGITTMARKLKPKEEEGVTEFAQLFA